MNEIDLLITITDRESAEEYINIACEHGVPMALAALGRGTATDEVLDVLGLESSEKAVMFDIVSRKRAKAIIRDIRKRMYLDIPGSGIVLTVPVSSIAGSQLMQLFLDENEMKGGEQAMMKEPEYEVIIAITNEGHTDMVMDAAREAGASGGTILHAKGTGGEKARKFFGLSLATEKEMVFIVTKTATKKNIMKSIVGATGLHTDARTFVMSLPVTSIEGLRADDDDEDAVSE